MTCVEIDNEMQWGMYSEKPGLVVVDMYADWCKSCLDIMPRYEKLPSIYPEVTFCKLDIDNDELEEIISLPEIDVKTIPMFVFFQDGELVDRYMGTDYTVLTQKVEQLSSYS